MEVRIETISDVVPHIPRHCGIIVSTRPEFSVIDHVFTVEATFATDLLCQCRGLKFDAEGQIIARPFHRFTDLTGPDAVAGIDWTRPHWVTEKLDGIPIHAVVLGGELRFMTRAGLTPEAQAAELIASSRLKTLCRGEVAAGRTPLFELTGPQHRIVERYRRTTLTLLASRDMVSGRYLAQAELATLANAHGVALAPPVDPMGDVAAFLVAARGLNRGEGYVIAFDDGRRFTMKAEAYLARRKTLADPPAGVING